MISIGSVVSSQQKVITCHPFVIRNNIPPPQGNPPNIDSHHYIFFVGKLATNATLKFDAHRVVLWMKVVSLLRYTNVGLQKIHLHKKEKLTTYYSIKTSYTQGWKLAGAQLPKAHKNLAGILEIEVYFSYLDRIGLLKMLFV